MADRYTITERVDQGGMAEVFRGVSEGLTGFKKNVAIKRILPNLTKNKKFVAMFLDEARLSLHLQHANIVHVFDIGIADTSYFIVMEFVDGINLKGVIEYHKKVGKRIKVAHTCWLMAEVCKGLGYAHELRDPETQAPLGIVHRDISPPNILISKQAEVKLVDFGLAKASSQIESTDPGVVKGKFSYLSPEAASGLEVDHRADIFAVGILLWEMLTGKRLFYGDTDYQTVELVRQAKIPSIAALNPEVSPDLEAVVRKALARDPNERYQLATDLQDSLMQILYSRGMKVTTTDVKVTVAEVVADRERSKPRAAGSKNLIDALIQDEMQKFTSLPFDDQGELSPGDSGSQEAAADAPLDPMNFVKVDNWASEVSTAPAVIKDPARRSQSPARQTKPPAGQREASAEIDSLQQILEPDRDRTGVSQKIEPSGGGRGAAVAVVVAVLLLGIVGGGLFFFKDKLFGGGESTSHPTEKK
jgi:serine/threonine-protein kinase